MVAVAAPSLAEVQRALAPDPLLAAEIRAFLVEQLGRVLPPRELDPYYEWVVLGRRSLEPLAVMVKHRPPSEPPVLDIGSGLGTFVLLATRFGVPAVGLEPGTAELELARRRGRALGLDDDRFVRGFGEAMPFDDESFSGALLHDVLEHVSNWRAVLAEAWRVLAPGGVLYVKGPSYALLFLEPHYRVPWLPLLPKPVARRYLRVLGRDTDYFDHVGYRRRGAVVAELKRLGFELSFPRRDKLAAPESINRPWARALVQASHRAPALSRVAQLVADGPLQSTIDVVATKPAR